VTAGSASTLVQTGALDGAIGAAVASYDSGTTALQGLNALASIFATNVNIGQAQGLTSTGSSGSALFSVPAPSVTASASNTGTAVVTSVISNSAQLPTDGGPFLLTYTTLGGWSALDQASGVTYTGSGVPPSFAGVTLTITGAPANGDQFTLNPAPGASTGISVAAANTTAIAAAEPYVATPGTLQANGSILNSNGGTLNVGNDSVVSTPATGAAVIPASYFGQSLQFNFTSPTAFNVSTTAAPGTTIASGTLGANTYGNVAIAYPASGAATGTYWQLPVSGTPVAGDVLTLTTGGPSSGGNATRIAGLWAAPGATTAGTLQQAIVGFGTSLGANAQTAQQSATATASQVSTATTNLQTVSGVSADQQAVTLTNYQQAYQAAAQAISAAHTAFESLLQSV
jgi:flagellar hook-associated protein 1 FlgK